MNGTPPGIEFGDALVNSLVTARPGYPRSPCIQVCSLDDDERCIGCRRTLQEIVDWARMSAAEQRAVIDQLPDRRP